MKEGRPVLIAFGVAALVMISLPIVTVFTKTPPAPPEQGMDGAVSLAFLAAANQTTATAQPVAQVSQLLPKGMAEKVVFQTLAASGFTCATDSNAATCFRSHETAACKDDWTIRLIFSDDGTVWSTAAKRQATCS